jgi:hypothetical protein
MTLAGTLAKTFGFGAHCPGQDCAFERDSYIHARRVSNLGTRVWFGKKWIRGTWTEDTEKEDLGGNRGFSSTIIEFCYLSCDAPNPRCGMELQKDRKKYTVQEITSPQTGWTCLTLNYCGDCA